jgi:hypothetical protein
MPRNLSIMVGALERIRELSFKACVSETEIELRNWNMRIHQEATKALDAPLEDEKPEVVRLTKMIQYQQLYIQYLIGGITKQEFKKRAKVFAEPLDIDRAIKEAKREAI